MKKVIYFIFAVAMLSLVSCEGQYDNLEKFAGEVIYPARFDTIFGQVGYERVELDLMKAGRIPASKIKLGKATKTVIE